VRYSTHYKISREELEWLGARVEDLGRRVFDIETARLAELKMKIT